METYATQSALESYKEFKRLTYPEHSVLRRAKDS